MMKNHFKSTSFTKLLLFSLALHLVLFGIFSQFGIFQSSLLFDKEEVSQEIQESEERRKQKEKQRKIENRKKPVSSKQSEKLKRVLSQKKTAKLLLYRRSILKKTAKLQDIYQDYSEAYVQKTPLSWKREIKKELEFSIQVLHQEMNKLMRIYAWGDRIPLSQEIQNLFLKSLASDAEYPKIVALIEKILLKAKANAQSPVDFSADPGWESLGLPEDKQIYVLSQRVSENLQKFLNAQKKSASFPPSFSLEFPRKKSLFGTYRQILKIEEFFLKMFDECQVLQMAKENLLLLEDARKKVSPVTRKFRNPLSILSKETALQNISQVQEFSRALDTSLREAKKINLRLGALLQQIPKNRSADKKNLAYAAQNSAPLDFSKAMRLMHTSGKGRATDFHFSKKGEGGKKMKIEKLQSVYVPPDIIQFQSLPGRRFDKNALRLGWIYIDTWHIIGPWENDGEVNYSVSHPPELGVDLDGIYTGKDGISLSWNFHQSDNIRIAPTPLAQDATYYLYTEVYFEEEKSMFVSLSSDDAAKVWINGQVIWQENGLSSWFLGEGTRKVFFQEGLNTILVRIENGPGEVLFSFLLSPEKEQ